MSRLGYLGPEGTFSEIASQRYLTLYPRKVTCVPMPSFDNLFYDLKKGKLDQIIIPIENSIEGNISGNYDFIIKEPEATITAEVVVPITHYLLANKGVKKSQITTIISHPQPLGQCAAYLRKQFPTISTHPALSTAGAVNYLINGLPSVESDPNKIAIIGTERLVALHHLDVLDKNIGDHHTNNTRFVVLSTAKTQPTGHDRTSIVFSALKDKSGGLWELLGEFSKRKINLTKISSRPTKKELGDYIFYVDLEGHKDDSLLADALHAVQMKTAFYKWLGSYKRDDR